MEKAFDRIKRGDIWRALRKSNVKEELINCIKSLYYNTIKNIKNQKALKMQ